MSDDEYFSPFIQETFTTTPNRTVREEYRERIKQIYYSNFSELDKMRKEDEQKLAELEKNINNENDAENEKNKQNELEKLRLENENKKNEKKNNENNDDNDEKKKDIDDNKKDENNDKNDKKEELKEEKKEEKPLPKGFKKMEKALLLLDTEYFGREHEFYEFLCKKYKVKKIENEFTANQYFPPLISESLVENELIKCYECQQDFIKSEFPNDEWRNGYFIACNRCAPDRNNIITLKWSEKYKSEEISVEHNGEVAKVLQNGRRSACIDMEPCKSGLHCFRWKTKDYQSWSMWGISVPKKYPNNSYSSKKVFGIAGSNQAFINGVCKENVGTNQFFGGKTEVIIDMLLDLSKGEMKYVIPGLQQETKITGIPVNEPNGYVPHINIDFSNTQVQIKKIPPEWYGKNPNKVKFQY